MEKPIISPDFTIEDIHKIREYNYELTKDMTLGEKLSITIRQEWKQSRRSGDGRH